MRLMLPSFFIMRALLSSRLPKPISARSSRSESHSLAAARSPHLQAVLLQLLDVGEALLLELREEVQSTLLVGADAPSTGSGVRTATCAAGCNFSFAKKSGPSSLLAEHIGHCPT